MHAVDVHMNGTGTVQSADGQAAVCLCGPTGVRAKFTVRVSGKADGLHSDDDVPETEAQTCVSQRCTDEEPLFVACGSALPGPGWLNFMPVQAYYNHVRVVVHNVHLVSCFHWDLSSIDWSLYRYICAEAIIILALIVLDSEHAAMLAKARRWL